MALHDNPLAELRREREENKRLRDVLRRIATDDYSDEDQALTSPQPTMIWQLVAQHALDQ